MFDPCEPDLEYWSTPAAPPLRSGSASVPPPSVVRAEKPDCRRAAGTLDPMFEQLAALEAELDRLEADLPGIYAAGDRRASRDAGRRHAELQPVVAAYREWRKSSQDAASAAELLEGEEDPEMREYLRTEVAEKEARLAELEAEINELLLPRDPNEGRNVIVEIQGAEGGEEGNLWAGDLYRMYQRFAERHGLKIEALSSQPSDHGGYRDVTFLVKGDDAWSRMKYEGGPHRVQRVPATESQGRIHTSAATVAILPEAEEIDVEVDPNEIEIDVFRADGSGRPVGQHDRLRGAADAQAHRNRRVMPGREEPTPEQGEGDADPAREVVASRAGPATRRGFGRAS